MISKVPGLVAQSTGKLLIATMLLPSLSTISPVLTTSIYSNLPVLKTLSKLNLPSNALQLPMAFTSNTTMPTMESMLLKPSAKLLIPLLKPFLSVVSMLIIKMALPNNAFTISVSFWGLCYFMLNTAIPSLLTTCGPMPFVKLPLFADTYLVLAKLSPLWNFSLLSLFDPQFTISTNLAALSMFLVWLSKKVAHIPNGQNVLALVSTLVTPPFMPPMSLSFST